MKASEPQNDRELLLSLNGQIERLSDAIDSFSKTLQEIQEIEEKKIAVLDGRLKQLEEWRAQLSGGWKLAVGLWVVSTTVVALIVKYFSK